MCTMYVVSGTLTIMNGPIGTIFGVATNFITSLSSVNNNVHVVSGD